MTPPRPLVRCLAFSAVSLALSGCSGTPTQHDPVLDELDTVAMATQKYFDVSVALADGFVPASPCESSPAGAMGHHYVHPGRMDGRIVLTEPEALLYIPEGGGLRLAGVEYIVPVVLDGRPYFGSAAPDAGPSPSIMRQTFQGPMPGHNPAMPWHWDLHVWLFSHNPAGRFAQWNSALRCP